MSDTELNYKQILKEKVTKILKQYTKDCETREINKLVTQFVNLIKTNSSGLTQEQMEKIALDLLRDFISNGLIRTTEVLRAYLEQTQLSSLDELSQISKVTFHFQEDSLSFFEETKDSYQSISQSRSGLNLSQQKSSASSAKSATSQSKKLKKDDQAERE